VQALEAARARSAGIEENFAALNGGRWDAIIDVSPSDFPASVTRRRSPERLVESRTA